jgi:hypothetical protein
MKNLFYSILTLCSITAFGQEKSYSFDKKISYKVSIPEEYASYLGSNDIYFINYVSKDALLGTYEGITSDYTPSSSTFNQDSFFIQKDRVFDVVTNSLENRLSIKFPTYYEGVDDKYLQPYQDNFIGDFVSIKNLNSTQTINGYKCNEFEVLTKNEYDEKSLTICVDLKNQLNNTSYLIPKANVKGLLVRLDAGDFNGFTIDKISTSTAKVNFDEKKSIEKFNQDLEKKKEEYAKLYAGATDTAVAAIDSYPDNRYDDPLLSYYSYANSENNNVNSVFNTIASLGYSIVQKDEDYDGNFDYDRTKALKTAEGSTKQIIKQYKKNGLVNKSEAKELNKLFSKYYDDAKAFKIEKNTSYEAVDATTDYDSVAADSAYAVVADIYPYESNYKTDNINAISLAIDDKDLSDYLKAAPEYCKDLKSKIPTFSDSQLKNLVYNYAGQVCDLYIYESGNVSLSGTIDALRKSVLEINNKYDKLKKEDKEKLSTFLNSLD